MRRAAKSCQTPEFAPLPGDPGRAAGPGRAGTATKASVLTPGDPNHAQATDPRSDRRIRAAHYPTARRLLPGVEVVCAARRTRPGVLSVNMHDPQSLRKALVGVRAVVNAVGPYDYDPAPVVTACVAAGCAYVDLAEAPAFIAAAQRAAGNGTTPVVSGCSTVPGLVQVLAQQWAGRDDVVRLRVLLGMGSANPVSPALLFSFLRPLGTRAPDGTTYFNHLTVKHHRGTAAALRPVSFALRRRGSAARRAADANRLLRRHGSAGNQPQFCGCWPASCRGCRLHS